MKSKLIFILFLGLIILSVQTVNAQNSGDQNDNKDIKYLLKITPAIINFEITPGKTEEFEVTVENFLPQPMGIRTSIEPLSYSDQSADYLRQTPLLSWANFETPEFIIDAQSKKKFKVKLIVPRDAPKGGQYGVVFLTPFYTQVATNNSPTILSKIGLLLIGTYGKTDFEELKKNVQITKFSLPLLTDNTEFGGIISARNGYFNHFGAKPFINMSPLFGGNSTSVAGDEKNILPKTTRLWEETVKIEPNFPIKIYKADLKLSIGEGNQIIKSRVIVYFAGSSYLKYLIFVIIFAILFKFRKRLVKAVKSILTNN